MANNEKITDRVREALAHLPKVEEKRKKILTIGSGFEILLFLIHFRRDGLRILFNEIWR